MILTVRLLPKEAKALTEMCRRFRYPDAQYLLTGARNVIPTVLCEAVTSVLNALNTANRLSMPTDTGPLVAAESATHVTIALAIEKGELADFVGACDRGFSATRSSSPIQNRRFPL